MSKHDYFNAYKLQFIHDEARPDLKSFAESMAISDIAAFMRFAKREDWEFHRDRYWAEVSEKVRDGMIGLQVNDNMLKLRQIQALKAKSWDGAFATEFKSARDAISSYAELEKLERLMLGESTENISITQLEDYMLKVVRVLKEEIADQMVLERVRARLGGITLGGSTGSGPDRMSN